MQVMVAGGAGYIGSHAVKQLIEAGHQAVVVDNLFRGHRQAVHPQAEFYPLHLSDTRALADLLHKHAIDCVMHFAALAYVGESVADPLAYYDNNTAGTISLLEAMNEAGVKRLVFSSTAATYGEPDRHADRGDHAAGADQPLRLVEVVRGADPARLRGGRPAVRLRGPAVFQRGRRRGRRLAGRRPRAGDAPDPGGPANRLGPPREGDRFRHRLPHARRHLHPRLHPRGGPLRGPHRGDGGPAARRRAVLQPGDRTRLLGQRGVGRRRGA